MVAHSSWPEKQGSTHLNLADSAKSGMFNTSRRRLTTLNQTVLQKKESRKPRSSLQLPSTGTPRLVISQTWLQAFSSSGTHQGLPPTSAQMKWSSVAWCETTCQSLELTSTPQHATKWKSVFGKFTSCETSKMPKRITFNGTPSLFCTQVNAFASKIHTPNVGHRVV